MKSKLIASLVAVALFCTAATYSDTSLFKDTVSFGTDRGTALNVKSTTVTTTTDSGAGTETITACFPARVTALGVTCRVTTVLAGTDLTTWSLGDGTDADLYGTTLAKTAGTTVTHANYTASPRTQAWSTSAANLTMTAAAGQFDSGEIRCTCFYLDTTAPAN